mgnify:FL=1|jgi:hypothetical protein
MGGRGSGSGRGGGSANIGALKEKEKSLNSQIDKLNKRLADYASKNPAWNMPSGYYDVQRKKQALESKKRSITNKIVTASRNVTAEKTNGKTFVNSFGEATKREITTSTYKSSQAKLSKEIMGFVGGEINRKKQTKRRK